MAQDYEQHKPFRLHESAPLFLFIDTLKEFFLVILLALFASKTETWQLWVIGVSAFAVLFRMVSVRFFKYWILPDELVVKSGVFFRQERHIPYERIQNINQTQGILHRVFGVCKVQLESASGTKPEAIFNVISIAAIDDIREASQGKKAARLPIDETLDYEREQNIEHEGLNSPLLKLPLPELVKYGLITKQGLIPIAIAFGFLSQQEDTLGRLIWPWLERHLPVMSSVQDVDFSTSPGLFIAAALGLLIFVLICFWILSIAVAIFRFYKFTLTKNEGKLTAVMGLITRRSASASLKRIQKITIAEGVLHRIFNRITISCKTAGNTQDSNNFSNSFHYIAPLLRTESMQEILANVQGEIDWSLLQTNSTLWQAIPYRAWRRMVKLPLFFCLIGLSATIYFASWTGLIFVPLAMLAVYNAQRSAKAMGFIYTQDFIAYRSGWLIKKISLVRLAKTQAVSLRQNPFDRRRNMARLLIDTAGFSLADHNIDIPYLEIADANFLQKTISQQMNTLEFEW